MANVELNEVSVAGVRMLVRSSGARSDEAILFVHGNPGSGADWDGLLELSGELAFSIAPDMPGYGRTERPKNFPYSVPGHALQLSGLVEQFGLRRVHLVLHDFGGPWGMAWAADHPALVASITLFNIGALPGYRWHRWAQLWRAPWLGELVMACTTRGLFRATLNFENPRLFPRSFTDRMSDDLDAGAKRAILALYRATPDIGALTTELCQRLAPLRLPALVIWGAGDRNLPVRYAEVQRRYFGAIEIHKLENCGHWPFIDAPEQVATLMLAFLRTQLTTDISQQPEP
jgi:pimeloyl-ACP methyl ester carboxylesterase